MYLRRLNIYSIHKHVSYLYEIIYYTCYNSLHVSGEFCRLPFANSLNPDEDQHYVSLDRNPNCLTLRWWSRVAYL